MQNRVCYRITPKPLSHQFEVGLRFFPVAGQQEVLLSLPAWIPGSYMIREFARNIVHIEADQSHLPLPVTKVDKHTWKVSLRSEDPVHVLYRVYAWDMSVRTSYLDTLRGFFNGTSVCLRIHGQENNLCEIDLIAPEGLANVWQVATGLTPARAQDAAGCFPAEGQPLRYLAHNYDELIDCPVEMGLMHTAQFDACGIPHQIVITGAFEDIDLARLCKDLKPVCEAQIRLFEPNGQAPFSRYVFMIHATDNGYGGLEHRNSTALLCSRKDLPHQGMKDSHNDYRVFLGLCSHEYFHAWNVKRIKPSVFVDYLLDRENYTRQLWLFEGFTSYYDDLILKRCGLLTDEQYADALAKTFSSIMKHRGHTQQSLSDSSFDAWIKYYRQDENSPNAIVSYYTKGSMVALCLDALIQRETGKRQSLDDVMRWMWKHYGKIGQGVEEGAFAQIVQACTGIDVNAFIRSAVDGVDPLPVEKALQTLGFELSAKDPENRCDWGLSVSHASDLTNVRQVRNGSCAERAGVSPGDQIVAIDGFRATEAQVKRVLSRKQPGEESRLHLLRRERLLEVTLQWEAPATQEWKIAPTKKA